MSSHSAVTEHLPGKTQELHLSNPFFTTTGESSESLVLKTKSIYIHVYYEVNKDILVYRERTNYFQ